MQGQIVYSTNPTSNRTEININDFKDGIYYIKVGNKLSTKIIKMSLE